MAGEGRISEQPDPDGERYAFGSPSSSEDRVSRMRRTPIQEVSAVRSEAGAKRRGTERLDQTKDYGLSGVTLNYI
jgi:hypothetical protein